ncbi:MAG TPA: response regulator transcription factor [Thermoleophilaceae bacterium]|nr:response regulator transcription factor [Thermoleophilaceae bacterium]
MPNERIRVVVADDHPLYRTGLVDTVKRRPDLELVGQAEDGESALDEIRSQAPDVCVLDVKMPGLGGVDVLKALEREGMPVRVVFVSAYYDSDVVYGALGSGASGYLSKDSTGDEICDALVAAAQGRTTLGADIQAAVAREIRRRSGDQERLLTPREDEVLRMTAEGLSAPDIARKLHLGATTVKTHLQRVYEKLGVSDRAAAVAEAMRRGILD